MSENEAIACYGIFDEIGNIESEKIEEDYYDDVDLVIDYISKIANKLKVNKNYPSELIIELPEDTEMIIIGYNPLTIPDNMTMGEFKKAAELELSKLKKSKILKSLIESNPIKMWNIGFNT